MTHYADTQTFYRCTAPRCPTRFFPVTAGPDCPVCGLSGVYAGIAVKEWDPTPEEEEARTVTPITEFEHAPPEESDETA